MVRPIIIVSRPELSGLGWKEETEMTPTCVKCGDMGYTEWTEDGRRFTEFCECEVGVGLSEASDEADEEIVEAYGSTTESTARTASRGTWTTPTRPLGTSSWTPHTHGWTNTWLRQGPRGRSLRVRDPVSRVNSGPRTLWIRVIEALVHGVLGSGVRRPLIGGRARPWEEATGRRWDAGARGASDPRIWRPLGWESRLTGS